MLIARLREGRAITDLGAAHFLRETLGRVRYAGATGQFTVRADSGFYTHFIVETISIFPQATTFVDNPTGFVVQPASQELRISALYPDG